MKITDREQQIINAIKADQMVSQQELADLIGISRSAIASHLTNLTAKGIVKGRGYVIATEKFCVVIGGANMDIMGSPTTDFKTHTSNPGKVHTSPGGVARNIAENLAKLDHKCYLISAVGKDSNGKALSEITQQAGVDISQLLSFSDETTSTYLSIVDEKGEMQSAIADMAIVNKLTPERLKKQIPLLKQAEIVMLDTNISQAAMEFLFKELPKTKFFLDTVSITKAEKLRPFLSRIYSLKPNLSEAQSLSGIYINHYDQLPDLANWFHEKGVEFIYISLGKDGLFYSDTNHQQLFQLDTKEVINSNGAGDAMTAALIHGELLGSSIIDRCYFALAAANLTLTSTETNNPNLSVFEVNEFRKETQCQH